MPLYEYACPDCSLFELLLPMGSAPPVATCPSCGGDARRRMSAPNLSQAGSAVFQLIDSANRSAHEPAVVQSHRPGARTGTSPRVTTHPLHQKLPRP